jgi:PucR-like helix-turn-helix protein
MDAGGGEEGSGRDEGRRAIAMRSLPRLARLGEVLTMSRPDDVVDPDLVAVLVFTLEAHLVQGSDIGRTAEVLGIHRSTVRYRLYLTRELTGLGPEDPSALQSLHRLRDRAEPPEARPAPPP